MELIFNHPEFEEEVRTQLNEYNRPLVSADALSVTYLDLSNFDFLDKDMKTLSLFKNLKGLYINIGYTNPSFWNNFVHMEELCVVYLGDSFDFNSFAKMTKLSSLTVSGGDISDANFLNLDALVHLKQLHNLELHEFGSVDLLPLASMPQLKNFALRYANNAENIDIIGSLSQLESLTLDGLYVDDLNFLDMLPDCLQLEMCGNHVYNGVDVQSWGRFTKHDICEISVKDETWAYIDLSALDA